jgi:hypothetical protein
LQDKLLLACDIVGNSRDGVRLADTLSSSNQQSSIVDNSVEKSNARRVTLRQLRASIDLVWRMSDGYRGGSAHRSWLTAFVDMIGEQQRRDNTTDDDDDDNDDDNVAITLTLRDVCRRVVPLAEARWQQLSQPDTLSSSSSSPDTDEQVDNNGGDIQIV